MESLNVGIIRLSSLGDIITSLVFVEFLKSYNANKHIEISFIVDSAFRDIVADSPLIDNIIDLPLRAAKRDKKLVFEAIKRVRNLNRFDMLIDAQGLLKTALVGKFIKKDIFVGFDKDSAREKIASFFYDKKAHIAYKEHILKRQYELFRIAFLDICKMPKAFDLDILNARNTTIDSTFKAKDRIANILSPFVNNTKILFISEASKKDKQYPLKSFLQLALAIKNDIKNAKILLIWDKNEENIREFAKSDDVFFVLPHLNLDEIKALLSKMDLVIGGDTGITHCAWALKIPSITIYTSTNINRFILEGKKHFSHSLDSTNKQDFTNELIKSVKKAIL